jgi:hypothetical protein
MKNSVVWNNVPKLHNGVRAINIFQGQCMQSNMRM